jgi:hypothetical protein
MQRPEIDAIEGGGPQSHAHIVLRADCRFREIIAETQLLQSTMRVDRERSHRILPLL